MDGAMVPVHRASVRRRSANRVTALKKEPVTMAAPIPMPAVLPAVLPPVLPVVPGSPVLAVRANSRPARVMCVSIRGLRARMTRLTADLRAKTAIPRITQLPVPVHHRERVRLPNAQSVII